MRILSKFSSGAGNIHTYEIQIVSEIPSIIGKENFQGQTANSDKEQVQPSTRGTKEQVRS
ncbi:hypothetical protein C922_05149 [Plasmodium inui San Antonio 1]|uniref:Uncharacterized protein n=1 Tax=Plasmodium inui San Antonio 1 TaxID=1237626 RepID=W7AGP0_9APIC|nr:hypothetical protein C922_05149 [Plasmodium inui San Antonio 1]EUD64461.1 hypothetical protein C922_05149 [Plasmodium inui San Antonio 1]